MRARTNPKLKPGRVYRTEDFQKWTSNPTRLAERLTREGKLRRLNHGLYFHPRVGRFGEVPPDDKELMRGFLKDSFVLTGSEHWNALGLGSTGVRAVPLVYNRKRSGQFQFGSRRFELRRVAFPKSPPPEWFVVDLLERANQAGVSREDVARNLRGALENDKFDSQVLLKMAREFGTRVTQNLVSAAMPDQVASAA